MSRRDVYVYNEATGFLITSRAMVGRGMDPDEEPWTKAVRAGDALPIELVQDDSFLIRVVAGDELTPQESEEWVGRLAWRLRVPDGRLAVTGGAEFVMEPFEEDPTSEFVRLLDVPAGDYHAVIYAYLSGINGEYLLDEAAPKGEKAEPAGAFFRRTRRDEAFPLWLRPWCVAYSDKDPGHEDEWEGQPVPDERPEFVDFLLHLTPLRGKPRAMPPLAKYGFFSFDAFEVRKPERCPLGLAAREVLRAEPRPPAPPAPVETVDVHSIVAAHALTPVAGGPVELQLVRLVRAYRLAWFATDSAVPELRIALPAGAAWMPAIEGLEMWAAPSAIEGGVGIGFADGGGKWTVARHLRSAARVVAGREHAGADDGADRARGQSARGPAASPRPGRGRRVAHHGRVPAGLRGPAARGPGPCHAAGAGHRPHPAGRRASQSGPGALSRGVGVPGGKKSDHPGGWGDPAGQPDSSIVALLAVEAFCLGLARAITALHRDAG